jgi:hypothetical protein
MKRLALALSLPAILISACTIAQQSADPVDDHLVLPSSVPGPGKPFTVTGIVGAESIEGGCAYLETADGTRYEVIYPEGWEIHRATGELTGPDGEHAGPGDLVSIRGSVAADRSSICQLGPIVQASVVLSVGD